MRGPPSYLIGRRNGHDSPWTPERDAVLVRLWAEGYSASQIADQIMGVKVSRCSVIGRVHRLKLPGRKPRQPASKSPPRERRVRQFVPKPPAPPPRPEPPPPPPPGEPRMRKLPLLELKPTSCRWPVNDGRPFLFCAATADEGEVYCGFHGRMARVRDRK